MVRNTASQVMHSDDIMACYFFRFTLLIPFISLLLVYLSDENGKKFQLRTWTKKVDVVSSEKITNGDTLGRYSTVSVVGTNCLVFVLLASLLKQRKFNGVILFCKL